MAFTHTSTQETCTHAFGYAATGGKPLRYARINARPQEPAELAPRRPPSDVQTYADRRHDRLGCVCTGRRGGGRGARLRVWQRNASFTFSPCGISEDRLPLAMLCWIVGWLLAVLSISRFFVAHRSTIFSYSSCRLSSEGQPASQSILTRSDSSSSIAFSPSCSFTGSLHNLCPPSAWWL